MKVFLLLLFFAFSAKAHESASTRLPIDHVLSVYSEENGVKFVVDPRVKGYLNLVGIDLKEITQTQILDMLLMNNIVAVMKDKIVYVLPKVSYEQRGEELGQLWVE